MCVVCPFRGGVSSCPLVAGCAGSLGFRTCHNAGACPLVVCSLLSSALSLCSCRVACKYGSISQFKGVLTGFWGACVGLCCLGALRGLCGFCTRVELGGFGACCVFASVFLFCHLLCLCSFSFRFVCPSLLWLSFFVLLHCLCGSLGVVVVSFSLTDYTQKERAQVLCVLSCPVVGLY